MDEEIARIAATREAIGPNTMFMLDMNAPYALDDCITFARRVEPYGIHWLREPLHWYLQPADFVKLAAATPIPLAHGERELTRFTVRDFIASGAIGFVQFDSTRAAGFTESVRIAHLAEQFGVRIARIRCQSCMRICVLRFLMLPSVPKPAGIRGATRCGTGCISTGPRSKTAACI